MTIEITSQPPLRTVLAANVALAGPCTIVNDVDVSIPGALINSTPGFMRGHGTYMKGESLYSAVGGLIEQVNKLIRVKPVKCRYQGEIGDVVIGRIIEVQQKRWKVDTNSRLNSALLLASVNLPGGELRRKSIEDELAMREYLKEGDLVSAEVQQCFQDGALSLHTRNLKYGKLGQGTLVKVSSHLIKRRKTHFCNLPFNASVILGCNGYIWVSKLISEDEGQTGGYTEDLEPIPDETRDVIARVTNCIRILSAYSIQIFDTTIINAYNFSTQYPTKELIKSEIMAEISAEVIIQCRMEEEDL